MLVENPLSLLGNVLDVLINSELLKHITSHGLFRTRIMAFVCLGQLIMC